MLNVAVLVTVEIFFVAYSSIDPINTTKLSSPILSCNILSLYYLLVWQMLIVSRWLYTRSIVIDGNFSAEHLKMKQPEEDVALSPGRRYMVEPNRYKLHLNTGKEVKQVSIYQKVYIAILTPFYTEITVL